MRRPLAHFRAFLCSTLFIGLIFTWGCAPGESNSPVLQADMPLHLEEHLDASVIEGSELPAEASEPIGWSFDEPQPDWRAFSVAESRNPMQGTRTDDALRVILTDADRSAAVGTWLGAGIYTDFPGLLTLEPAQLVIRARTESAGLMAVIHDELVGDDSRGTAGLLQGRSLPSPMIADGSVQSYLLPLDTEGASGDACCRFGVGVGTREPGSVDILSVRVVSRAAAFAGDPLGVMTVADGSKEHRRTLFTHTPGRVAFTVRVPPGGRLDVGLGVLRDDAPVDFSVMVTSKGQQEEASLLEETLADRTAWVQRSVDLSAFEGQTVTLALLADAEMPGTVALWAAPTLSRSRASSRPNVIFYVIDGAGADWMSLYGYNRRTTPFLERLAGEAVVFENAYSNATATPMSTPSYMTSLLYSAIDRYRSYSDKIPDGVTTMAEHFGRVGYQTGVFVSNPFAATMSGLERGVDLVRVLDPPVPAVSSEYLHRAFWDWKEAYPGTPYWAHFQTTDVHEPFRPKAPFSGLFITPELRARYIEWDEALDWTDTAAVVRHALAQQALYDEGMAHQDHHLERFVERLKAEGRWENTILVIASDHGYPAGSHRRMPGLANDAPHIHPFATRVPLMFVWPGHIEGQRIGTPVSMIDVLPTLLDLTGLPQPQMRQGESLAPLLLGQVTEEEWEHHPVFVDVLLIDEISGELIGNIEVIDGRWGASLCVRPEDPEVEVRTVRIGDALTRCTETYPGWKWHNRFPPRERLLVYDLWDDPLLERPINEERPDLVEKYTELLEAQVELNAALRGLIAGGGQSVELSPEDLEQLRTLGYIQ